MTLELIHISKLDILFSLINLQPHKSNNKCYYIFKLMKNGQFTTTSKVIYYTVGEMLYVKIHSPVKRAFIIVSLQSLTVSGGKYQVGRGRSTV